MLGRLVGDARFERVARRALRALYLARTSENLVGVAIDVLTGQWMVNHSNLGAGVDSFYEYLFKAYVLTGDDEYLQMFDDVYYGVIKHMRRSDWFYYDTVDIRSGQRLSAYTDSLASFFPGLQVLIGDVPPAMRGYCVFDNIWRRFASLPERFDQTQQALIDPSYPLRPEFVESTYHLYRATKDPAYLAVAERLVTDINELLRQKCGFAGLKNVLTRTYEDRMESFFLSETLKYLYLIFDEDNIFNRLEERLIFTTGLLISTLAKSMSEANCIISIRSPCFSNDPCRFLPVPTVD